MEEKCEKQFNEMAGTDGKCSWTEFNSGRPSEYMNGWTAAEVEAAFNMYCGNDANLSDGEWQQLCA